MTEHHLKTWPEFFQAVQEGRKPFEFRLNDRDYQVGDVLVLEEYVPTLAVDDREAEFSMLSPWTGRSLRKLVTYIFDVEKLGPRAGIRAQPGPGYVIMVIEDAA